MNIHYMLFGFNADKGAKRPDGDGKGSSLKDPTEAKDTSI